jgi:hypothetical protein
MAGTAGWWSMDDLGSGGIDGDEQRRLGNNFRP